MGHDGNLLLAERISWFALYIYFCRSLAIFAELMGHCKVKVFNTNAAQLISSTE